MASAEQELTLTGGDLTELCSSDFERGGMGHMGEVHSGWEAECGASGRQE